jgi:hypothetical protein
MGHPRWLLDQIADDVRRSEKIRRSREIPAHKEAFVDFEWNQLGELALRRQDEGLDLLRRGAALLDENEEEAFRLRDQGNAKVAEADNLQAEYIRMFEQKKEENHRIRELFEANPDCETLREQEAGWVTWGNQLQ